MKIKPEGYTVMKIETENDAEGMWLFEWLKDMSQYIGEDIKKSVAEAVKHNHAAWYPIEYKNEDDSDPEYLEGEIDSDDIGILEYIKINSSGF